jgi:hypothetical protein
VCAPDAVAASVSRVLAYRALDQSKSKKGHAVSLTLYTESSARPAPAVTRIFLEDGPLDGGALVRFLERAKHERFVYV